MFVLFLSCTTKWLFVFCITFDQAANAGKSLFLLYALKRSPRLTLFYLYLFDYSETFLPFLHTCCPAITHTDQSLESSFLNIQVTRYTLPVHTASISLLFEVKHSRSYERDVLVNLIFLKALRNCHLLFLCFSGGAQLATVGGVSCEVPPASLPADSRVCLGLVGRPLLDISLHHC